MVPARRTVDAQVPHFDREEISALLEITEGIGLRHLGLGLRGAAGDGRTTRSRGKKEALHSSERVGRNLDRS
jgi:hypothetical protein